MIEKLTVDLTWKRMEYEKMRFSQVLWVTSRMFSLCYGF